MNKLSLKQILLISVLSLVGISVAISSYLSYLKQEQNLAQAISSSSAELAMNHAKALEQFISEKVDGLKSIGQLYKDHPLPGNSDQDYIELAKVFANSMNTGSSFIGFEKNGDAFWSLETATWPNHKFNGDVRTKSYYKDGRKAEVPSMTEPYPDSSDASIYWISMVQKIQQGMIGVDMKLGFLNSLVKDAAGTQGNVALILNKDTTVLASSDVDNIKVSIKANSLDWFKAVAENVVNQASLTQEYQHGQKKIAFSHQIKVADKTWYFVLILDKAEAFHALAEARNASIITTIIVTLISLIIAYFVIQLAYKPILSLKAMISSLASGEGDLTQRLEVKSKDDLGQIADNVNKFISNLQEMMVEIKNSSVVLHDNISQMKVFSENNAKILDNHVIETEQVVTAIEEMNATSSSMATDIANAASLAQQTNDKSDISRNIVAKSKQNISELIEGVEVSAKHVQNMSSETENINTILSVIGDIAEQTNLLALNAAIEAARAGDQGRGFAVVADEVRNLATRTKTSTEQIEEALTRLLKGSQEIVSAMEDTKAKCWETSSESDNVVESLSEITNAIIQINELSTQIATAAEEQSSVTHDVSRNMNSLSEIVNDLAENGEQSLSRMTDITQVDHQLSQIVGRFKL
ncbi:methyl-accepting chemotaxis protein [Vibrio sp.]|nr:methyl-accepting chemotaxis protein [Vibrio sp.]